MMYAAGRQSSGAQLGEGGSFSAEGCPRGLFRSAATGTGRTGSDTVAERGYF